MELGIVGLGKMGGNMVVRLIQGGHKVVAYDRSPDAVNAAAANGAAPASSLKELVEELSAPRAVWVMVPDGAPTEETINGLVDHMASGDIIIDGGNSKFTDDVRRAKSLAEKGIEYMDVGTSGGVWGLKVGYCLMIGGEKEIFDYLEPIFKTLAPADGYGYMGSHGAGHFVKMVHNGVEYAMMQAYAEGFALMKASEFQLDCAKIADLWQHGSVVRSWLLELGAAELAENPELKGIKPYVNDSGEGRWTVQAAVDRGVPLPAITAALFARFESRQEDSFALKFLNGLRNQFGGHTVVK
ncbi:MAG TPA: decarboxylating 6-phosphogluconate dehydrogenase [Planctomycetota bacterium]|jgi:6-phosphogluconate dehydrogenase